MALPRISFSLRAFLLYFVILATLAWFILDKATERLNIALRQSAETVLVDTANLLAVSLEQQLADGSLDTWEIERLFDAVYQRKLQAQIYAILKQRVDTEVYITNQKGVVVYDSTGVYTGQDFSQWRDVRFTLEGQYGARTSFRDPEKTEEQDDKVMVIAAPITLAGSIIGVVSVVKPVRMLEQFLSGESQQLKQYAIGLLALAMFLGYVVSYGFTASTARLANFANDIAAGKKARRPEFLDKRFSNLSHAIAHLRQQLDGKEYVEQYVHSITHELKTPITAIQASSELLQEEMPVAERARFLKNIRHSTERMNKMVDRLLSLARIESQSELMAVEVLPLRSIIEELIAERELALLAREVSVQHTYGGELEIAGDRLLITQAIANLLDNAIDFAEPETAIRVSSEVDESGATITVFNAGEALQPYVAEQAFDRFFSVPGKLRPEKSTGLGLSFVKEIMSLHSGSASIHNGDGGVVANLWWPHHAQGALMGD